MLNRLVLLTLSCVISVILSAQQYNTSIGVKGDWSNLDIDLSELSAKHFFTGFDAVEANFGFSRQYFWIEGMYHRNQPMAGNVDWYSGAGVDFGYWDKSYNQRIAPELRTGYWTGLNAVIGIEYTTSYIPINLALDIGPTFRLVPERELGLKIGFACRFAFGGR